MKSNQLMSIPFNGRANFDQIDFVKCNRIETRETHTDVPCPHMLVQQVTTDFCGICEYSIASHSSLSSHTVWIWKICLLFSRQSFWLDLSACCAWSKQDFCRQRLICKNIYIHFQPFSLPLCSARSVKQCKCSQKWQKRREALPHSEMFPLESINPTKINLGKKCIHFYWTIGTLELRTKITKTDKKV